MKLMSERVKNIKIRVIEDIHDYELQNSRLLEDLDKLIFECENEESKDDKNKFRRVANGKPYNIDKKFTYVVFQDDVHIYNEDGILLSIRNDIYFGE